MKKLVSLTARFADDVFRVLREATLEELAELRASPLAPASPQPAVSRGRESRPRAAPRLSRPSRAARGAPPRSGWQRAAEPTAAPEPPAVAEITDPERLLRIDTDVPVTSLLEPPPDPPPSSTPQPTPITAAVLLRANEALVRASNAGIVIRRRKGA
jgi:hypothetical protein